MSSGVTIFFPVTPRPKSSRVRLTVVTHIGHKWS